MKLLERIRRIFIKERFYKFTERNQEEGEVWHFYMPLKKAEIARIREAVRGNTRYQLSIETFTTQEVALIVSQSEGWGYYPTHNRQSGVSLPPAIRMKEHDPFEKGLCWI